jgi:hypothetical protein
MIQLGRPYMVTEMNQYTLASKISEAAGYKNPEMFFTDPRMAPPEAKQPPPNPDMVKLQQDKELKVMDAQVTAQQTDKKMMNERWIAAMQAEKDQQTKIAVAQLTKQAQENTASINADTQKRIKLADAALAEHSTRAGAEIEVYKTESAKEVPMKAAEAVQAQMDANLQQLATTLVESNKQVAEALTALAAANEQMAKTMNAKKRLIRDKSGKAIGVETIQ